MIKKIIIGIIIFWVLIIAVVTNHLYTYWDYYKPNGQTGDPNTCQERFEKINKEIIKILSKNNIDTSNIRIETDFNKNDDMAEHLYSTYMNVYLSTDLYIYIELMHNFSGEEFFVVSIQGSRTKIQYNKYGFFKELAEKLSGNKSIYKEKYDVFITEIEKNIDSNYIDIDIAVNFFLLGGYYYFFDNGYGSSMTIEGELAIEEKEKNREL